MATHIDLWQPQAPIDLGVQAVQSITPQVVGRRLNAQFGGFAPGEKQEP